MDLEHLRGWVGRTEARDDVVTAAPVAMLAATLDRDEPEPVTGTELPPPWHWMYFTPRARQSEIARDGHANRGGFLPPVPLPRRMWAGSRMSFPQSIHVGDALNRRSRIASVDGKAGRSGMLVFVCVRHEYFRDGTLVLAEEHDIVYRDDPKPGDVSAPPKAAPSGETFFRVVTPDPTMLFRYSAVTFNAHRIHYDRPYVTGVEGYPGLIVHGPLTATLLLDLLRRNRAGRITEFTFRAIRPLFDLHPFTVCGRDDGPNRVTLWTRDHEGYVTMEATAAVA